ncbi:MAG: CehA/McbA family metallohydrolase [Acidimicrobiia bacterium]
MWYRGNTHTHTLNSDGDSTPDEVVRWYREHGYHFLVLTDHNSVTNVEGVNALHGADAQFLVIRGEEVSGQFGGKPIHVNGLNVARPVTPQGGSSVAEVIQRNIDAIRTASGVPHINHPNVGWTITAEDLKQIWNDRLLEIFNGHPFANNLGGGGHPSLEETWDEVLSSGKLLFGIAADDAHDFKRPWAPDARRPGQGWVMVRAKALTASAIVEALERGEFYASTGVEISDYESSQTTVRLTVREAGTTKYRVLFIGGGGRILKEVLDNPAVYTITGDEGYVRAKIVDSNGKQAWTQPVFVDR